MDILLFGADGRLGSRVLEQARADGHDVTAFVREPDGVPADVPTVVGTALDADAVADAVRGQDVVCSTLGSDCDSDPSVITEGTTNVVSAMEAATVGRLVAVGSAAILQATPALLRLETPEFPDQLRPLATAHREAYERLRTSSLSWTLVCPPSMPDGIVTRHFRTTTDYLPDGGQSISLGDIASFVYQEVVDGRHLGKRVGIAY
jgi:putative NADH-flavin reductase